MNFAREPSSKTKYNVSSKEVNRMQSPRIVAIVGSLRKESYNRQLALTAKEVLGDRAAFEILEYEDIPFMNQDIEYPAPEAVRRVRAAVREADGLWIFTPEYNHSYPGVLKNLIDWLSRPISKEERQVLAKKPIAVSGITPGMAGTSTAQDLLVMLLSMLNANVMNLPRLAIPNATQQTDESGRLKLVSSLPYLERQANAFLKFIEQQNRPA
jgi:chromate reductase